jgi:hypothetical protein
MERNMKWTFGICFGSTINLKSVLDSIVNQDGMSKDDFEIIIVGKSTDELIAILKPYANGGTRILLADFDENVRPGWITRKKNIITQLASYDNICYMHDYVALCVGWYRGFVSFGGEWDVCMNCIRTIEGKRFRDWILSTAWWGGPEFYPYDDASRTKEMYISGTYWCAKKKFMTENPLDERRCWGQGEDVEWSFRCRDKWNYKMNKKSSVRFLKEKTYNGKIDPGADNQDPDIKMSQDLFIIQK